jgi:hypothetical protein
VPDEYVLTPHLSQVEDAFSLMNLPEGHAVQAAMPAEEA